MHTVTIELNIPTLKTFGVDIDALLADLDAAEISEIYQNSMVIKIVATVAVIGKAANILEKHNVHNH